MDSSKKPRITATLVALTVSPLVFGLPAISAPVFDDAATRLTGQLDLFYDSNACSATSPQPPSEVVVLENGVPQVSTITDSASLSANGIRVATITAQSTGSTRITSSNGNPATLDLTVSASAHLEVEDESARDCTPTARAGHRLDTEFTVSRPGFMHLTTTATPGVAGQVLFYGVQHESNLEYVAGQIHFIGGPGDSFDRRGSVYLPAGGYRTIAEGSVAVRRGVAAAGALPAFVPDASGTVTVSGVFIEAGSQTEPVAGRGAAYVSLPSSRSCSAHAVTATLSADEKRAQRIKKIGFYVNGKRVVVRDPTPGKVVVLPVADPDTAEVVARVTLEKRKHQKHTKRLAVRSAYEACSAG